MKMNFMILAKLVITAHFLVGTPHWTVDVDPTLAIDVTLPGNHGPNRIRPGMALPNLILIDPRADRVRGMRQRTVEHEIEHTDQWSALGPGFLVAYTVTGGAALEDYHDPHAWKAPRDLRPCPLLRIDAQGGTLAPCWRFDTPVNRTFTARDGALRATFNDQVSLRTVIPKFGSALAGLSVPAVGAPVAVAPTGPVSGRAIALNVPAETPGLNKTATRP